MATAGWLIVSSFTVLECSLLYSLTLQGDSLIFDHQWELEKIQRLLDSERTRHFLLLKDKTAGTEGTRAVPATGAAPAHQNSMDKSEKVRKELLPRFHFFV
jgi:hypothetical protein